MSGPTLSKNNSLLLANEIPKSFFFKSLFIFNLTTNIHLYFLFYFMAIGLFKYCTLSLKPFTGWGIIIPHILLWGIITPNNVLLFESLKWLLLFLGCMQWPAEVFFWGVFLCCYCFALDMSQVFFFFIYRSCHPSPWTHHGLNIYSHYHPEELIVFLALDFQRLCFPLSLNSMHR